ncbi:unnamed protein product [Haemonchus placei]|uniref:MFS domain-containing protein n=1 Tax=Haemonchus placei TaxID=6290 RepID=A0A0N4X8L3_HAEPC|nr:unnamed protein product [Haemonchus placei]
MKTHFAGDVHLVAFVIRGKYRVDHEGNTTPSKLVPLSSLKPDELGHSILLCKQTLPPGSPKTPHDIVAGGVFIAKVLSLSSSAVGAVMVPVLTSYLWEAATERPSMMMFTIVANTFLVLLSFTPLLLHFLAKRFPVNLYYNHDTKTFTSVHYNFFLRKMAMQFKAHEVVDAQVAPEMGKVSGATTFRFSHETERLMEIFVASASVFFRLIVEYCFVLDVLLKISSRKV